MAEAKTSIGVDVDKLETDFLADPGTFVPLARAYIERHLAGQAVEVCKKGLKAKPGLPEGLLALAMAHYHNYDDRNAEKVLKEVLRVDPNSAAAHRALGEILLERHQDQRATSELLRALELEPRDQHTRALLRSLNEKIPAPQSNGLPANYWLPRQSNIPREPTRPIWHALLQVLVVAGLVVAGLIYYNHSVNIKLQIRDHLKKANAAVPRDNYPELLAAEKELDAVLALNPGEEKAMMKQAFVRSLLWVSHGQEDRKAKLQAAFKAMEETTCPTPNVSA